jgi:hypothetical protein
MRPSGFMREGGADYLLKDRLGRLGPAVKHALLEKELRQEKIQAEGELEASAVKHALMENELREEKIQAEGELEASEVRFQSLHAPQPGAGVSSKTTPAGYCM